jgi:hypothetical protein
MMEDNDDEPVIPDPGDETGAADGQPDRDAV